MASEFSWFIDQDAGRVELSGRVDETANFATVLNDLQAAAHLKKLQLDVSGITRITSYGVREWIRFITALSAKATLEIQRCSPFFVAQLNMIRGFAGNAPVTSVMVPYVCTGCSHEERAETAVTPGSAPNVQTSMPCPECHGLMEFDDIIDNYFSFLR